MSSTTLRSSSSSRCASATSVTLQFTYSGRYDMGLDDVRMTAAVPEPETYALMLAGLGALGAVARRRKR